MAEREPYARHIAGVVDFVLRTYRVRVNWRIVALDEEEWTKISSDRSAVDEPDLGLSPEPFEAEAAEA